MDDQKYKRFTKKVCFNEQKNFGQAIGYDHCEK